MGSKVKTSAWVFQFYLQVFIFHDNTYTDRSKTTCLGLLRLPALLLVPLQFLRSEAAVLHLVAAGSPHQEKVS